MNNMEPNSQLRFIRCMSEFSENSHWLYQQVAGSYQANLMRKETCKA